MRLEQDLNRAKRNLKGATRNRIVGGVILLIGAIVLIQFNVFTGVVVLLIGAWVFIRALVKVGQEHRSIDTATDKVADARTELDGLEAQRPVAE